MVILIAVGMWAISIFRSPLKGKVTSSKICLSPEGERGD